MSTMPNGGRSARRTAQRGISLVTTLVFMLAALVLGVSVMGVSVMQERIIGNTKDRDLALQAAEAALRDAEADISTGSITAATVFTDACTSGLCTRPTFRATPDSRPVDQQTGFSWTTASKVRTYGQFTGGATFMPTIVASQPVYVIEAPVPVLIPGSSLAMGSMPPNGRGFRITARATGARPESVVILQEIYATP